ncbi:MAG: hypothetical protein K2Y71_16030 [Xanthobacteraceae bacterium]|nr:hypothetical protein [Xanthobacteraceae bacterium]
MAMAEYQQQQKETLERTARLRAERLAREAKARASKARARKAKIGDNARTGDSA